MTAKKKTAAAAKKTTTTAKKITLCGHLVGGLKCRLFSGHRTKHDPHPSKAWDFLDKKDKAKLNKAGFATPRGGGKGAYQNHVSRSNKVIIPYERLTSVDLSNYEDGYVIRLFPNDYFLESGVVKTDINPVVALGENSFILYRTNKSITDFPPLKDWLPRAHFVLDKAGNKKKSKSRNSAGIDEGQYVFRTAQDGNGGANSLGIVQGIFAPEYANREINFLCRLQLAKLIISTEENSYSDCDTSLLDLILSDANLYDIDALESKGMIKSGLTCCPLCEKVIKYKELSEMISLDGELGLENAGIQIEGSTRSTRVNLYHMLPLNYKTLQHQPYQIAWGHAVCNTKLGQRRSFSIKELREFGIEVRELSDGMNEHFGWKNEDGTFIKSEDGSVWINIFKPEMLLVQSITNDIEEIEAIEELPDS